MKIYRGNDGPKIIKPLDDEGSDNGRVIVNGENEGKHRPDVSEKRSDEIKEIIANDVITLGAREAALVHGVGLKSARAYGNGEQMSEESKVKVLDKKHEIENLALTKLMATLSLLDPENVEKERDRVAILTGLSTVIDKITDKKLPEGSKVLHLHLYDPGRNAETDYKVIDV